MKAERGAHDWQKLTELCKKRLERGYGSGYLEQAKAGQISPTNLLETFSVCLFTESGLMDANGRIVRSELRYTIAHVVKDKAKLRKYLRQCAVNRETPGTTGIYLYKCLTEDIPKDYYKHVYKEEPKVM